MKRLTTILLIAILAFNLFGYNIVFTIAENNADKKIFERVYNSSYDEESLVKFEMPLYNAYQMDNGDFQYVSGEITIGNRIYKLVKQRVIDGALQLYCLFDESKTPLLTARNEYFRVINDFDAKGSSESKNSKSNVIKLVISEYENFSSIVFSMPSALSNNSLPDGKRYSVLFRSIACPGQPPELL